MQTAVIGKLCDKQLINKTLVIILLHDIACMFSNATRN